MQGRSLSEGGTRHLEGIFIFFIFLARERILQKTEPETLSSLGWEFNTAAMKAPLLLREAAERFLWKFLDVTDILPSVWQLF